VRNSEVPPRTVTLTVVVTVTPVNEFPPVFPSNPILMSVSEATAVGRVIGQVEASDQDLGKDGLITYSLVASASNVAFIHPASGSIILTDPLDFKTTRTNNMTVLATDNSLDPVSRRSATALLSILVQDANDSPPAFSRGLYTVSVQEDSNRGHTLTTLSCTDQDTERNSQVTYSITSGNNNGIFSLAGNTGEMTLAGTLDFDAGPRLYSLMVRCRETQPPNQADEALVLVQVTSFNEFRPDPGSTYYARIQEDTEPGALVLQVRGTDRDYGPAGALMYFINNNNNNHDNNLPRTASSECPDNLYMDSSTGAMYLMVAFDHESRSSYHCTLSVWDSERPIHLAEQDIIITVVDVNDAPTFCISSDSA
jgi:hypothetical protein